MTERVIGGFYEVYNQLGYGFLESIYCRGLEHVLRRDGLLVEREYPAPVRLYGTQVGLHRIDLLVERRGIVEVKSTELLSPFTKRQLRNYLRALHLEVGLILHFGPEARFTRMVERV
ncbi:MAG: GxxExxY protein [Gemmatimonadaceae bacterium]|nr:GxxExxY protein [Gemmatimonadaceae bacterium]